MFWLLFLLSVVAALLPIETKGNAFFAKDSSERFYIRGVDYQPGGSLELFDPLADPTTCERDIKYFKELGINTIRVYSVDNTADHDVCMEKLADAGIYLILDVNIPKALIARDSGANCSYNTMYLNEVLSTVKVMSQYNNTLGFFAANEVINTVGTSAAAPYVKAVVRDIKTFQRNTGLRLIPVGYSAADIAENNLQSAYFNCGDDELARVDMFGFNDYSWCGDMTFSTSGYDLKVEALSNYSIPLFFSEFGCNSVSPRPFTEVGTIYSDKMLSVFSGGLVYEYSEETSEYGLVLISSDNSTVTTNSDFTNLKKEFSSTSNPSGDGGYQADLSHSDCPAESNNWKASSDVPDTPEGALKYINGWVEPEGSGFDGDTQWACDAGGNYDAYSGLTSSTTKKSSTLTLSSSLTLTSLSALSSKKSGALQLTPSVFAHIVGMLYALVM